MNWKGLKGLVLLLSITLAFPSSAVHGAAAQRSSQKQRTDSSQKFSSKGHSSLTTFPSSELYESGTKRDHETADSKEAPLIRLKRIKRQTETASSSSAQRSTGSSSNWPGTPINAEPEVLKFHDKSLSPIGARPTNAVSDRRRFSASHSSAHRDSTGSRVHTKMLRKKESANRNGNRGGGKGHATGKVPTTRKSNEISDPVQTAAAAAIGHHHKSSAPGTGGGGGGGYFHHRNEQSRLESAAEFALRQRTPHKKTKRLKNRSELDLLKAGGRTGHAPPPQPPPPQLSRPRPAETVFGGGQANRYHDAMVKARGRGHAAPVKAGHGDDHGGGETSHRSRRGQRSGATAVNGSGGGGGGHGGQKVRAELEHIKRMQRDLMKEISHLEHMKKKKKVQRRSASSSSSSSLSSIHQQNHRQQIAKAHRK